MNKHRVAITGMGLVSPIGGGLGAVTTALRNGTSGVRYMPEWEEWADMHARVAAPASPDPDPRQIPRKIRRGMGRQAIFAAVAAQRAVADAQVTPEVLSNGRTGLAIGSTLGSPTSLMAFYDTLVTTHSVAGVRSTQFLECMSHTCAANTASLLGIRGRVHAPVSACTSGSQSIGHAVEAIQFGLQDVMLAGGADEAHFTATATFDIARGASRQNDTPTLTPRPFDAKRDGLVVGEGAGVLVLERLDHAKARGAHIYAEIAGYATMCDGSHITQPQQPAMEATMRLALENAGVTATDIDYINAHATATLLGDPVEAAATRAVFGDKVPVSSTKGHTGHTLGACGALETIFTVLMMRAGFVAATRNLTQIDEACQGIQHVQTPFEAELKLAMNNNFAFGGVNTSLVIAAV